MGDKLWLDEINARIYEDFLESIAHVREGADPETMFREHEKRVAPLRAVVEAAETSKSRKRAPVRKVYTRDLSKWTTSAMHA